MHISIFSILALAYSITQVASQTWSTCNPLTQWSCPADPALGRSVNIDFSNGASDSFAAAGAVSYNSNGAAFTVARSGDSPTVVSKWYIMFGRVDFVVKAAPGTGIVSSAVLQSDCLDEIDWEWLGGDDGQVQSNYFGKGITTTYNRGAFHGVTGTHDSYHTYTIDWTADQIVWQIDGQTVRVLTQADAAAGQYPQTPMQIKVGAWAGGDSANAPGTIAWAGGYTDYSAGPFTMYVKSISATDYSTGSQYVYSGTAGTWQSIQSTGGTINTKGSGKPVDSASAPAVTSAVPNTAPFAFNPNGGDPNQVYATRTGWPWYGAAPGTQTSTPSAVYTSIAGLPSGWIITDSGKVVPPNSGAQTSQFTSSVSASSQDSSLASGLEVRTSWDDRGFLTLITIDPAAPTQQKSYDSQGFLITNPPSGTTPTHTLSVTAARFANTEPTSGSATDGSPSGNNSGSQHDAATMGSRRLSTILWAVFVAFVACMII